MSEQDRYERFKAWVIEKGHYHAKDALGRFERFEQTVRAEHLRKKALAKERD